MVTLDTVAAKVITQLKVGYYNGLKAYEALY